MGKSVKLTEAIIEQIWQEDEATFEGNTYTLVEEEDWQDDGKYSNGGIIFKDQNDVHYACWISRSGSYYTDYDYQYGDTGREVSKQQVTTTQWVAVK